jgi:hypothetical protein
LHNGKHSIAASAHVSKAQSLQIQEHTSTGASELEHLHRRTYKCWGTPNQESAQENPLGQIVCFLALGANHVAGKFTLASAQENSKRASARENVH